MASGYLILTKNGVINIVISTDRLQITMTYNVKWPTATVDCEPLLLASEDVLYPGSDKDESIEEQQARRRRIELQAQHYLRGRELFVLSAHLRGPFADGWINPWARKRKRNERRDGAGRAHGRIDRREASMQEGRKMTIPETTRPSRTWLDTHNAVGFGAGGERSSSAALTPVLKLPKETLPAMAKLNPSSDDKVLDDEFLHCTSPSAASKLPLITGRSQATATGSNDLVTGHDSTAKGATVCLPEGLQGSLKVVPPSSMLPAFEYRPMVRNDRVNESEFEKAQAIAKAQEHMFRQLSFNSTADMEHSKSTSQNAESPARRLQEFTKKRRRINKSNVFGERDDKSTSASNFSAAALNENPSVEADDQLRAERSQSSPPKPRQLDEVNVARKKDEKSPLLSTVPPILSNENLSLETDHQPAAQVVPPDPVINGSGPSTSINLLETDRGTIVYPSTEDSTQAAIQKAMRSFQEDVFTPLKNPTNHARNQDSNSNTSLTMSRAFQAKATPEKVFLSRPVKRAIELNNTNEELMSTQAMIDAASPFTFSDHPKSSPISSTKSNPSLSTLNSLNVTSSGNLTNEYRHDGQQRPQVQPPSFDESGFDLDGAISEALHFLRASQMDDNKSKNSSP